MNNSESVQEFLFRLIKERLPAHVSFVHEISELLGISYDSAYRRIRGKKELTLEELKILCSKYSISMDTLLCIDSRNILFNTTPIGVQGVTFEVWLRGIHDEIKEIHSCKEKEILYSAKDIPVFHYFEFPEVFAFKTFFWHKVLFPPSGFEDTLFNFSIINRVRDLGQQMLAYYNRIPTTELWNEETFDSLVRQIEYCYVCNYFSSKEDAHKILDAAEALINHLDRQAELGFRFLHGKEQEGIEGSFKLYCNEVLLGDNTIFVNKDGRKKTFLTYNVVNLLVTENKLLCEEVENCIRNLTKKSTLISGTSEKERHKFFHTLIQKVDGARIRINQ